MKKGIGISLSEQALQKVDSISEKTGRTRSLTLERIIMSMSESQMIRHARRTPVYSMEGVDNATAGENT